MLTFIEVIIVILIYLVWKQNVEMKKLRSELKEYHIEIITPLERLTQRMRSEIVSIAEEALSKEQINNMDKDSEERLEEFEKAKNDPLDDCFEKDWFC